jgi:hypothetical protein
MDWVLIAGMLFDLCSLARIHTVCILLANNL